MPGFDQTGPMGFGPKTGRGAGRCLTNSDDSARDPNSFYGRGKFRGTFGGGTGRGYQRSNRGRMFTEQLRSTAVTDDGINELRDDLAKSREKIAELEALVNHLKTNLQK